MELVPYLSAVILIATIATILLAVLSYAAFKLRDRRRPKQDGSAPVFFRSYEPDSAPRAAEAVETAEAAEGKSP